MARLSVNINKVALLRNARGSNRPDVLQVARDCERFGAEGITVHPRPDGRHIRYADVYEIPQQTSVEFNVEGYPSEDFLRLVEDVRPAQVTLVPDPPEVLTSSEGWDTHTHASFLREVLSRLREAGIRSSLFIETRKEMIRAAGELGADRVELYTGPYAAAYADDGRDNPEALEAYVEAARWANEAGLGVNAGHDLDRSNLGFFLRHVPHVLEVSIGHALICDALYEGLATTIHHYLAEAHPPHDAGHTG